MGNAVAPAPSSASDPMNTQLSSTTELPASTLIASSDRSSSSPPPPSESKSNNFIPSSQPPSSTTIDVTDPAILADLTPLQLLFYSADVGDCDLIRQAADRGANVSAPDLGLQAQDEEKRQADEKAGKKKTKAELKAEKEREQLYKNLIITSDTALHKAAAKGHAKAIELLFNFEADLDAKNNLGSTPLHRAVSCKQVEAVKVLLAKGSRLDATTTIGNSPLHVASYMGEVELAQLILTHAKHDAFRLVVACNNAGLTPIDYARKKPMHALLSSYRPAVSHTSSFVGLHAESGTPKHGMGAVDGMLASLAGTPVEERRRSLQRAGSTEPHPSSHGDRQHHHHHAPNPPPPASNSQSASRSNTLKHVLPTSLSSEHPTDLYHPVASLFPQPQQPIPSPTMPSLQNKPSFEKTSSLDSHPTDEEERSVLGSMMVSPMYGSGDGKGRAVSGATLSTLSFNMLPNECEAGEEEEKEQVVIREVS